MKVREEKTQPTKVFFENLNEGDCFMIPDSGYHYMKTNLIIEEDFERYNAVYLEDGEMTEFGDDEEVIPIKGEFVIK